MARMTLAERIRISTSTILTTPYREWLTNHGDDPLPDWVLARLIELMRTRPRVRHSSFASSSGGQCLRKQEFEYIGARTLEKHLGVQVSTAVEPGLMNVFNDGRWRHLRHQGNMLAGGLVSHVEFPLPWPAMRSMGSVDAVGVVPANHPNPAWRGKSFGVELKGVNMFQYQKFVAADDQMDKHKGQFNRYFLSGGFDLFVVFYENKNFNDWHEWVLEPDPVALAEARQELEQLNMAADQQRLHAPLNSCRARMGKSWDNCPFAGRGGVCERMTSWPRKEPSHDHRSPAALSGATVPAQRAPRIGHDLQPGD